MQVKNLKRKQGNQHILWNYNQGDFAKAKCMINTTNWDQLFSTDMNISLQNWQSEFLHIMEACIPKSRPSSKRRLPWLTRRMLLLINKKNKLFRAWRQSGSLTLRRKYIALRNSLTNLLKSAKKSFFRNVNTTDQKRFWKSVHLLTSSSASVPTLVHDTGVALTSQERQILCLRFLQSVSMQRSLALALLTSILLDVVYNTVQMISCALWKKLNIYLSL